MMARQCEGCDKMIEQKKFLELAARLLKTDQDDNQDAVKEVRGDYCDKCISNGKALKDLLSDETLQKRMNV